MQTASVSAAQHCDRRASDAAGARPPTGFAGHHCQCQWVADADTQFTDTGTASGRLCTDKHCQYSASATASGTARATLHST